MKTHLIPQFGRYKLREITNADVLAFTGKLLETLAPDTVRTIRRCLSNQIAAETRRRKCELSACKGLM